MIDEKLYGTDLFGDVIKRASSGPVSEMFGFPPFSVLDARQGVWQDRKKAWVNVGIQSEVGRDAAAYSCNADKQGNKYDYMPKIDTGTSIFDPTLCECIYRWFTSEGYQIVDPFAGGSVRGIVAGMLDRKYWGCDIRQEQVDANKKQAEDINPRVCPEWVCGDSMDMLDESPEADFIFSCPPYGDLEKYSDEPSDLSTMEWHTFAAAYKRIILRSVKRLNNDRFACFVVGDFRDKRGFYRDFVSLTISAFRQCGMELYNEGILVTPVGTACMRVTKQFNSGRKFAKTHQNVLVFCKGDWRKAVSFLEGKK